MKTTEETSSDELLQQAIEAMHRVYRVLTEQPDKILLRNRLGRAHHRILYVVAQNPDCSVTEICDLLRVTRQAANAPLRELARKKLIRFHKGELDSRVKLISLTAEGARLEARLTDTMRKHFANAFSAAGPVSQAGWFAMMKYLAADRVLLGLND